MDEYTPENLLRDKETLAKAVQSLHLRLTAVEITGTPSGASHTHLAQDNHSQGHPLGLCREKGCRGCDAAREFIVRQTVAATRQAVFARLAQVAEQLHMLPEANRLNQGYLALEANTPGIEIAGLVLVP